MKFMAVALVFLLLGGIAGAAVVEEILDERIDALEERIENLQEHHVVVEPQGGSAMLFDNSSRHENTLHASQVYELALEQVVGITTEVTYTNFFGMTSSAAVTGWRVSGLRSGAGFTFMSARTLYQAEGSSPSAR